MNIYQSSEDYLEKMLMLRMEKGIIKSVDIARELGVTKPSVSYAVKNLKENGYITMDAGGEIHLTEKGEKIATSVYERHEILSDLLMSFGVSAETAEKDACQMEHGLSSETIEALKKQWDKFRQKK